MWHDEISLDLIMLSFRSVWPSSVDGELSDRSKSPIAIYAIILFRRSRSARSCYFDDRDVRDRVIFNWSVVRTPRPNSAIFLLVLGSIPRPDRLFQASVIHGLCQIPILVLLAK